MSSRWPPNALRAGGYQNEYSGAFPVKSNARSTRVVVSAVFLEAPWDQLNKPYDAYLVTTGH